jgi:hypothetical protein
MKISRKLTSGEVLVLFGAFHFSKKKEINLTGIGAKTWLGNIANFTNLKHSELIELHEKNLIDKKLITPRRRGEKGSVLLGQHYRLTELGYQICIFVENYDEIYEAEQAD